MRTKLVTTNCINRIAAASALFATISLLCIVQDVAGQGEERPLSAIAARSALGRQVTVETFVQTAKDRLAKRGEIYLDSELDFRNEKNFAVVIAREGAESLSKIGIDTPTSYFENQWIRAEGVVTEVDGVPRIEIHDAQQIQRVEVHVLLESGRDFPETRFFSTCQVKVDRESPPLLAIAGFSQTGKGDVADLAVYDMSEVTPVLRWRLLRGGKDVSSIRSLRAADLDGDGRQELIALGRIGDEEVDSRGELQIFRYQDEQWQSVAYQRWQSGKYTHGYGMDVADLDGNGIMEIVTGGFFLQDSREQAELRVWKLAESQLELLASTRWGSESGHTRLNSVCIGDVTGDGRSEIVSAGRTGQMREGDHLTSHEADQLIVWRFDQSQLVRHAAYESDSSTLSRFREVKLAEIDGRPGLELLAVGRQESHRTSDGRGDGSGGGRGGGSGGGRGNGSGGGRGDSSGGGRNARVQEGGIQPLMTVFQMQQDKLYQVSKTDFSDAAGEVRDVAVFHDDNAGIQIVTITANDSKPNGHSRLEIWQPKELSLQTRYHRSASLGDQTHARQIALWGQFHKPRILTIGFVKRGDQILGQVLDWGTVSPTQTIAESIK